MLSLSSSLKASGCSFGPCFLELDRRNGNMEDSAHHLIPRKISAHSERNIILAVVFGVIGSVAVLLLIYCLGRHYLLRQNRPSSTDLVIERPIETKQDHPRSQAVTLPTLAQPVLRSPETVEAATFTINHPYANPYTARNTTSMPMPPSIQGTLSAADSSSVRPISIQSMPHPYSSQQHQISRHENTDSPQDQSQSTYNNSNVQPRLLTTTDETQQQYESFLSPETPRSSFIKELGSSPTSPDTLESGIKNTAAATKLGGSITIERRNKTGIDQAATTTSTLKPKYSPSVQTHDTVHSDDTLPSMYSYTSTSGPVPIQELHSPQRHLQPRTQIR